MSDAYIPSHIKEEIERNKQRAYRPPVGAVSPSGVVTPTEKVMQDNIRTTAPTIQPRIEASSRYQQPRMPEAPTSGWGETNVTTVDEPGSTSKTVTTTTRSDRTRGQDGSPNNRYGSQPSRGNRRDPIQEYLWRQRTEALRAVDPNAKIRGQYINHSVYRAADGSEYVYDRANNRWVKDFDPELARRAQEDDDTLYSRGRGFFGTELNTPRPKGPRLRDRIGRPKM